MNTKAVSTNLVVRLLESVGEDPKRWTGAIDDPNLAGLKREVWLAWNPRVLKIRTALEKASQVFAQVFTI